jgi:hypothetical protein
VPDLFRAPLPQAGDGKSYQEPRRRPDLDRERVSEKEDEKKIDKVEKAVDTGPAKKEEPSKENDKNEEPVKEESGKKENKDAEPAGK